MWTRTLPSKSAMKSLLKKIHRTTPHHRRHFKTYFLAVLSIFESAKLAALNGTKWFNLRLTLSNSVPFNVPLREALFAKMVKRLRQLGFEMASIPPDEFISPAASLLFIPNAWKQGTDLQDLQDFFWTLTKTLSALICVLIK